MRKPLLVNRLPNTFLAPVPAPAPARLHACLPAMLLRALARPTRTSGSGRVFGAHPRGEFRTSGAAVGQIGTRAASAAFLLERGGLSEQRGWAPKALRRDVRRLRLCAATSGHQGSAPHSSTQAAARAAKTRTREASEPKASDPPPQSSPERREEPCFIRRPWRNTASRRSRGR